MWTASYLHATAIQCTFTTDRHLASLYFDLTGANIVVKFMLHRGREEIPNTHADIHIYLCIYMCV